MTEKSKALDQYFTPPELASELINAVTIENPVSAADFAAGDGELLRAVAARWKKVHCTALDIDTSVVEILSQSHPEWTSDWCDFTDAKERKRAKAIGNVTFPLIVLNPPFSCKGKPLQEVDINGIITRCSPALAFIITAVSYLQKGGQLVAIVPYGLVHNERDRVVRDFLKAHYLFEIVGTYDKGGFVDCSPRTAIIRLTAVEVVSQMSNTIATADSSNGNNIKVSVMRGRVPNNSIEGISGLTPFVHTTNLKENNINNISRYVDNKYKTFKGPGVILPRVGRPSINKVVMLRDKRDFVISECVFILECKTLNQSKILYNYLIRNWTQFTQRQGGTCANFLSIQSMIDYLALSGFDVLPNGQSVRSGEHSIEQSMMQTQLFS